LIWGIKGVDYSRKNRWDYKEFGDLIYDEGFDISSEENQTKFDAMCNELKVGSSSYK
jgi:hypothetical protein